jgi:glycosyltransferase involved in cell wall biosynthesis
MNILFVNKISPEAGGGAETRIRELGKRFVKRGCKVYVLCAKTKPGSQSFIDVEGIRVFFVKTCPNFTLSNGTLGFYSSRIPFYLFPLNKLKEIVTICKPDVIIEDISPTLNPSVSDIAKRYRIPLIYSIHEVFEHLSLWIKFYGILGLWGYVFEKKIRERKIQYHRIITVAEWVRLSLIRDIPDFIVHVIQNGVDLDKFKPVKKKQKNDRIHLLNIGRFVPHKGHVYLLEAIKRLSSRSDIVLHLVGYGPLLPKMMKLSNKLGIKKQVIFHGYVPDEELLELYSKSDVFILPSIYEGFPVAILEAMAMALPIVSTNIPAIKGILDRNNAIIVKPANSTSLAYGIERVIGDEKLRKRLSNIVRYEAVRKFDWEKIADVYLSYLSSIKN